MGKSQMRRLREASFRFRKEEPARYEKMCHSLHWLAFGIKTGKIEPNGK